MLGGLFVAMQLVVGLACEVRPLPLPLPPPLAAPAHAPLSPSRHPPPTQAQYELFVAAALGTGLSVTALLMPTAAPGASGEIGESGTYPKELPLGLSFWLEPVLDMYLVLQPCRMYSVSVLALCVPAYAPRRRAACQGERYWAACPGGTAPAPGVPYLVP